MTDLAQVLLTVLTAHDHRHQGESLTDALFAIADAIRSLSENVRSDHPLQGQTFGGIDDALRMIAEAIREWEPPKSE
jgi:hypothetical protein